MHTLFFRTLFKYKKHNTASIQSIHSIFHLPLVIYLLGH